MWKPKEKQEGVPDHPSIDMEPILVVDFRRADPKTRI
jgi:hypothetical protein